MQVLVIHNSATTKGACRWQIDCFHRSQGQRHLAIFDVIRTVSCNFVTTVPRRAKSTENTIVSRSQFEQMVGKSELLEWAEFANYSTPRLPVGSFPRQVGCAGNWARRSNKLKASNHFYSAAFLTELERIRSRSQDSWNSACSSRN